MAKARNKANRGRIANGYASPGLSKKLVPVVVVISVAGLGACVGEKSRGSTVVSVSVNGNDTYQTIEGFGASTVSKADGGVDEVGAMRRAVIGTVYGKVGLTMGDLHASPYEGRRADVNRSTNDNTDPTSFNWSNFNWWRSDPLKSDLVDLAQVHGFDNYMLRGGINSRWATPWMNDIRSSNYDLYLQETAEHALAVLVHWRDRYGIVPRWHQLYNEPLHGNREVWRGTEQELVDVIKATGARFETAGFGSVKLVVPSETNADRSLRLARRIMSDPTARQYVGAISYHSYDGSYTSIAKILSTSGSGAPVQSKVTVRKRLRDLAARYGVQLWMTEVSNGRGNFFDTLRGRAIHIHDEMTYANINSFWGMWNIWATRSEDEGMVDYDSAAQTFRITGMGGAVGHYARWINRGAVRLGATSGNKLVQVTAFRDPAQKKLVMVAINNNSHQQTLNVKLSGVRVTGSLTAEQSTAASFWKPLAPWAAGTSSSFSLTVPALSVTSLAGKLANKTPAPSLRPLQP
jgi:O-glycosyl hydrolase